jgi:hypothetical protein
MARILAGYEPPKTLERGSDRQAAILPFATFFGLRISLAHQQSAQAEKY